MLEGKALIEDTDMPVKMQIQAMSCASQALDVYDVLDCKAAAHIKKRLWTSAIPHDYEYMKTVLNPSATKCSQCVEAAMAVVAPGQDLKLKKYYDVVENETLSLPLRLGLKGQGILE
ncbi:hypothetical protein RND71_026664 [Anisodus tanguticus]|uniref:Uncharacterized protein n=1 Tax=Anisodus tanguticus TaxID=243964 RepID=A0AAE1RLD0_9SOLA|nr:hypothetical protein RND71_026664 [Anisodus tanguticus]